MTDMETTARSLIQRLHQAGFEAYFAGGYVRDRLLGTPHQDYDIATAARPEQVQALFPRTLPIGAAFGVILVMEGDDKFEVATFRTEGGYQDGRRPQTVTFASAREDVRRRDFTVNGMLYDIREEKILDWVGGREDLEKKIIRCIGNPTERFQEDYLRMLRAVRFTARLGFTLEPETFEAIKAQAENIRRVSAERIQEELTKMLTGPHPEQALDRMRDSGILSVILPEMMLTIGVEQPAQFHPEGDVYNHTRQMLALMKNPEPALALMALLHDVGKPQTQTFAEDRIRFHNHDTVGVQIAGKILERLRFSKEITGQVLEGIEKHMNFANAKKMRVNTLKRFIRRGNFQRELELHRLDCTASHGDLTMYDFLKSVCGQYSQEEIKPVPLLTGRDLIALGFAPSPHFKQILLDVEDQQLENKLMTKEEAVEYVKRQYGN
jgi:poly(A) polymerase